MINEEYYKRFLRKPVAVGIEHYLTPNKCFWVFGTLLEITRIGVTIETKTGFRKIPFEDIKEFHLDKRRNSGWEV